MKRKLLLLAALVAANAALFTAKAEAEKWNWYYCEMGCNAMGQCAEFCRLSPFPFTSCGGGCVRQCADCE